MNSTQDTDMERTACFFVPELTPSSYKPAKLIFPNRVVKNIKLKRTSSQIELPRLITEYETTNRDKRTQSNKNSNKPVLVRQQSSKLNTMQDQQYLVRPIYAPKKQGVSHSQSSSPQKIQEITLNSFLRSNIVNRSGGKSFLKSKPQQKLNEKWFKVFKNCTNFCYFLDKIWYQH
ncbi:hypothetical protein pb186bvf_003658 [Paramecium bursaria]